METIDFHASFGFSPKKVVRADLDYVRGLLAANGVKVAFLHSLKGLCYDPMEGNADAARSCRERGGGALRLLPAGTFNPLEGIERCAEVVRRGLEQGIRFWRLYPAEHGFDSDHPVVGRIVRLLAASGCVIACDGSPSFVRTLAAIAGESCPVVSSLHYYDSADWCLRLSPLKNVFPTSRLLHGPKSVEYGLRWFPDRLVFCSDAPFGSPAAAIGIIPRALRQTVMEANGAPLLRRIRCGC